MLSIDSFAGLTQCLTQMPLEVGRWIGGTVHSIIGSKPFSILQCSKRRGDTYIWGGREYFCGDTIASHPFVDWSINIICELPKMHRVTENYIFIIVVKG